ncbi:hypothetical protein [Clostridium ljungdahlii]|uniref:Eps11J n=1 Tax=Clostridium ljungdahlii TaxID=1538 RepID=A0A162L0W3_9CLOT|nr:hypothetical protein [Clostridium ljungdahlii]OAA86966.1 hypothetical protein WY13_02361 [Clostridium ljungdahlii]
MKLLLIMPNFFDYPQVISEELNNLGYEVDCFDDRPSTNGFIKAIIRVKKDLINHYIKVYFNKMMETVRKNRYDIVLLISGQSLSFSADMIKEVRKSQPNAKFVLYQWDSLRNFPSIQNVHEYFDKCYSFDKEDVNDNSNLKFLPLFYSKRYEEIAQKADIEIKYDFCFVGTAHPKKYKYINMMSEQLMTVYNNQFIYFFFPSRLVFLFRKLRNMELRKAQYNEFHYTPLNGEEMDKLISQSRCILDSAQAGQVGLTIRVLEALGAKKKLITTNEDIKNYDFYQEENIYVYDGKFDYNSVFFSQDYKSIAKEIYEKYSLKNWLKIILS